MFLRSVGFLQEMWQAPALKSDTVQEEQGFPVCPGQARKRMVTVGRPSLSSEKKLKSQDWVKAECVASNRRSRRMLASKKFEHSEERAK